VFAPILMEVFASYRCARRKRQGRSDFRVNLNGPEAHCKLEHVLRDAGRFQQPLACMEAERHS
jgi:hypothetical protein